MPSNFIKIILLISVVGLDLNSPAMAGQEGDRISKPYKRVVVQISTILEQSMESGFGFVVGKRNDKLYVVTAKHVVRSSTPDNRTKKVSVKFFQDQGKPIKADVLEVEPNDGADLALLRLPVPDFFELPKHYQYCTGYERGETTWFIGREKTWFIPLDIEAGSIRSGQPGKEKIIKVSIRSVMPGTSGAPLITSNGIIGLITTDDGYDIDAVPVQLIYEFVQQYNYPWDVPQCAAVKGPEMVNIQGGCFQMGSPSSEEGRYNDNEKQHRVCVYDFALGKHEVTIGEFKKFINATDYRTEAARNIEIDGCWGWAYDSSENKGDYRAGRSWRNPGFKQNDQYPVVCVSWNDTMEYIDWLNGKTRQNYRLPKEAEWEYAARGGRTSAYFWGNPVDAKACNYANVNDKNWAQGFPCDDGYIYTAPVGNYRSNEFGLHDMLGNVWEWTCSKYDKSYQGGEKQCLGKNNANNSVTLVVRGGSFGNLPRRLRSANRYRNLPWIRNVHLGFRLARTLFPLSEFSKTIGTGDMQTGVSRGAIAPFIL